ncbi:protein Shroom4 isoform X2 [Rhinatrema bivittatum]|nr:protein Shroom4 isoform X2 [Rhinatrema bivittatum]
MQVGDELVNINGTPLYGSRQEALILIKGSYRILKMIVRRRNVPVIRPHSWHLAKLSEVRTEAGTMHFPSDAFSLSWHSGCEPSDLSLQWNHLSRHCSTDKSSSIGSMESLDQPSQTYFEGNLSPVDQSMYHNKRDSAYSSFSASSNTSDYTLSLRPEEGASMDCILQGLVGCKHNDDRYLQTGNGSGEASEETNSHHLGGHSEPSSRPASCTYETNLSSSSKAAPQPPVRRDSLRASKAHTAHAERRRASAPVDSLHLAGRWASDTFLSVQNKSLEELNCHCGQAFALCSGHAKDPLSSDQYYMLSSQMEKSQQSTETLLNDNTKQSNEFSKQIPVCKQFVDNPICKNIKDSDNNNEGSQATPVPLTDCAVPLQKDHALEQSSGTEHLEASDLQLLKPTAELNYGSESQFVQERHQWTMSPLHSPQHDPKNPSPKKSTREQLCYEKAAHEQWNKSRPMSSEEDVHNSKDEVEEAGNPQLTGTCGHLYLKHGSDFARCYSVPNETTNHPQSFQPATQLFTENVTLKPACSTETLEECKNPEESKQNARKPVSSRQRSAQMRKRSDRFATNLRNEIQRRKAQLQKSKGSSVLLCGEEPVQETDEPCESACPSPLPHPLPPQPSPPKSQSFCTESRCSSDTWREKASLYLDQDPRHHELRLQEAQRTSEPLTERSSVSAMEWTVPAKVISSSIEGKPSNGMQRVKLPECLNQESDNHELKAHEAQRNADQLIVSNTKCNAPPKNRSYVSEDKHSIDIWRAKSSEFLNQETKSHELRVSETSRTTDPRIDKMVAMSDRKWNASPKCKSPNLDCKPSCDIWRTKSSECLIQETKGHDLKVYENQRIAEHLTGRMSISEGEWNTSCPSPDLEDQRTLQISNRNGGRWKWSPEHKLQPQFRHPKENQSVTYNKELEITFMPNQMPEDSILLPFADRRKFFEETSKSISTSHHPAMLIKPNKSTFRSVPNEKTVFQPVIPDCRDHRRHSVDQTYHPASPAMQNSAVSCSDYLIQGLKQPICYKQGKHSGDCLRALGYTCNVQGPVRLDPCIYCSGDICPVLLKRNLQARHHSYRCHHHQWPSCAECCCISQHNVMEESSSVHGDHWQLRKPFPQELPLEEWEQQARVNRKISKSASELPLCKIGFQRLSPFRPCCESAEHERPTCFRTVSSHDLSRDHDRPIRAAEASAYEDGPEDPPPRLLRGRAFSESHINFEPLNSRGQGKQEPILEKPEESRPEPLKKRGPPPPRPPPPDWGRVGARRSSLLHPSSRAAESVGGRGPAAQPEPPGRPSPPRQRRGGDMEAVRQRSQSLPLEQVHRDIVKPTAIPPPRTQCWLPQECSASACHPSEQVHFCSYQQGARRRLPEPLVIDTGNQHNSRPTALRQERLQVEVTEDAGESAEVERRSPVKDRTKERQQLRPAVPSPAPEAPPGPTQESAGAEGCRLGASRRQAVRLNSDELMRDVADRDRSLAGVLNPASGMLTAAEVMGDLFTKSSRQPRKEQCEPGWSTERLGQSLAQERYEFQPISPPSGGAISPTSCSAYYNTSAGKAELLNKMKGLPEVDEVESDEDVDHELAQRKMQLIESIGRKLSVLQEAQRGLLEDIAANSALGDEVEALVKTVCKANEFDKYRMFIGDLDKVVNLLLSLSGRLARVENALNSLDPDTTEEEKLALIEKKRQLTEQLEDAKELKEHVDRREKVVYDTIARCLMEEQLQDYHHFVKMKSALIIEQRELEEKIKLGEEQLRCLRESLLSSPKDY